MPAEGVLVFDVYCAAAYMQGNVEVWLGEVERRMRSSVRHQIIESMKVSEPTHT
jgi:hypothetical protein